MNRKPKTHCINGHEIAVYGRNSAGHCQECQRLRDRRKNEKRRQQTAAKPPPTTIPAEKWPVFIGLAREGLSMERIGFELGVPAHVAKAAWWRHKDVADKAERNRATKRKQSGFQTGVRGVQPALVKAPLVEPFEGAVFANNVSTRSHGRAAPAVSAQYSLTGSSMGWTG